MDGVLLFNVIVIYCKYYCFISIVIKFYHLPFLNQFGTLNIYYLLSLVAAVSAIIGPNAVWQLKEKAFEIKAYPHILCSISGKFGEKLTTRIVRKEWAVTSILFCSNYKHSKRYDMRKEWL